jgi:hypothetical protein
MCLLIYAVEALEDARIRVAGNKRKFTTASSDKKLLLLRVAGGIEVQTNTARLRNIRLHMRVDNLKLALIIAHIHRKKALLHDYVGA